MIKPQNPNKILFFLFVATVLLPAGRYFEVANIINIRPQDIVLVFLALAFILGALITQKKLRIFGKVFIFPIVILLTLSVFHLPFQGFVTKSFVEIVELLEILLVFLIVSNIQITGLKTKDFQNVFKLIFFLSLVGSLIGIGYYFLTQQRFVETWFIFGFPAFGLYYSYFFYTKEKKRIYLLSFVFFLIFIILSRVRGVWIAVLLAPLILWILQGIRIRRLTINKRAVSAIFLMIFITVASIIFIPAIQSRVVSLVEHSQFMEQRYILGLSGLRMAIGTYGLGVGIGNFPYRLSEYLPKEYYSQFSGRIETGGLGAHSDLIKFLSELGFLGIFFYCLFWYLIYKKIAFRAINSISSLILATFLIEISLESFLSIDYFLRGGGLLLPIILYMFLLFDRKEDYRESNEKNRFFMSQKV